ncbi:hypothetical protein [Sphingomonas sp. ABOLE]|uniref:hypothetical protein n=1 Tax=Sphingomonas sp. ABOLE TaxID=1985878 RepID=UPI0013E0E2E6|nr:hypothetical protein [Sphingomonas sp. ABOLE]
MPSSRSFFERRAQEERARAASCGNPVVAAAFRRRAEAFQHRANAQREDLLDLR